MLPDLHYLLEDENVDAKYLYKFKSDVVLTPPSNSGGLGDISTEYHPTEESLQQQFNGDKLADNILKDEDFYFREIRKSLLERLYRMEKLKRKGGDGGEVDSLMIQKANR